MKTHVKLHTVLSSFILGFMLIGLGACDSGGSSGNIGGELQFHQQALALGDTISFAKDTVVFRAVDDLRDLPGDQLFPEEQLPVQVEAVESGVRIEGFFLAPCSRQPLKAEIQKSVGENNSGVLKLHIWPKNLPVCPNESQAYQYEAGIVELMPETYRLQVVYEGDVLPPHEPETVVDTQVQIQ